MSAEAVQPLRISKNSPAKSNHGIASRALAEISPMERRRNSPSWNQATKKMIVSRESSPFDSSISSPRGFWANKLPSPSPFNENSCEKSDSPSISKRRTSIENLKRASRVKNSSMFAREQMGEYDPSSPVVIERPLAAGRPLSGQIGTTNYSTSTAGATRGIDAVVKDVPQRGHRRGESQTQVPLMQPTPLRTSLQTEPEKSPSPVPSRHQPSPVKSSLIKSYTLPRHFDPSSADLSDDDDTKASPPRALRRQAKSVTFDVDPQTFTYEMATPDPSSVASGSREGSYDPYYNDEEDLYDMDNAMDNHDEDSFDASLEDTDKTPVVLPEDWRGMSPEVADATLTANMDDVFKGEDMEQRSTPSQEWHKFRTASIGSDPDSRPLPPVPQFAEEGSRRNSANILDRVHTAQRSLPTLPQASSLSKSDILNMKDKTMTVEDRLRLMGLDDVEKASPDQVAREKARLQRHGLGIHVHEDEQESRQEDLAGFTLTKISRESILRRVKDRSAELQEDSMAELAYSPPPSSPPRNYDIATLDPDVPIPSREASDEPQIKEEPYEDFSSFHSLPAMYTGTASPPAEERSGSVVRHSGASRDDSASVYSAIAGAYETTSDEYDPNGPPTPRADDVNAFNPFDNKGIDALGLPDFAMEESDFQASLHSYMSSGPDKIVKPATFVRHESPAEHPTVQEYIERDVSPVDDFEEADRAETPESILHNPIIPATEEDAGRQSPVIPEPLATIKAPGTSLKTRPSLAPADIETMAATRRQVSGGFPPPVPEKSPKRLSFNASLLPYPPNNTTTGEVDTIDRAVAAHKKRRESFRPKLEFGGDIGEDLSLDLDKEFNRVIESSKVNTASSAYYSPVRESLNSSLYDFRYTVHGFEDDDNIPYHSSYPSTDSCSKKGYLMRQNTKVVVAKRNFSNETSTAEDDRPASADDVIGNPQPSPRKPQHDRSKSWTTEPWNGKARRKSLRSVDKKPVSGPAPPLPGQASALQAVQEDQSFNGDDFEDGVERGRLFVKVVGVKDLNLPLPQAERTWFSLTLDNGLHCVTTSRLELGRSAPIGQEFELVVLNDLEFQLSLQTHIAPPAYLQEAPAAQSSKIPKSPVKKSAFSRFLASPKKKREQERIAQQQRLDDERVRRERQAAEFAARSHTPPSAWDLLHELVGEDGSFGRAYVSLKNHEESCFGRPITVDIPLFNEWAVEDPHISSSMKSKRGNSVLRRPPYQIGNLTLQLLYVPRPKGVDEEDMPKSMNGCIRDMAVAERTNTAEFEGFLSQQGGDCPYWRRRYFKLSGTNLTAYHETTRQPRTRIDLIKASKVIDDKSTLLKPTEGKRGGRRKSAFADEDQAYMFVEEGFRLRFANGEAIDFYAESKADKDAWMKVLTTLVGKDASSSNSGTKAWCEMVLTRERALLHKAQAMEKARPRSQGMEIPPPRPNSYSTKSVPSSPVKREHQRPQPPLVDEAIPRPRSQVGGPPPQQGPAAGRLSARRHQIKSMIF